MRVICNVEKIAQMKIRKKIYYVGGMISLIFIPIIFWFYTKPTVDELNLRVIDLGLPYKIKKGEKAPEFAILPIEGYSYKTINLPTNFDEKIEKKFQKKIENLQKENIDKTGIKFQLSDNNNYNDLVRLINLMQKTNQDRFGLDTEKTNAFYVIHRKQELNNENDFVLCGGVIFDYIDQNDYDYKHSNFIQKAIKYSPKQTYYLVFGFLILVYASLNRMLKFNKKTLQITRVWQ